MRQRILPAYVVAACIAAAACSQDYPTISLSTPKETYVAQLTGAAVTPPATTAATGTATFIRQDTNSINYEVLGAGLPAVTRLQIQAGTAADSGLVMTTLFTSAAGVNVDSNRVVRAGTVTRSGTSFAAPFTYDSLVRRIREGTAFVLVRTTANPLGAVRGQLARQGG